MYVRTYVCTYICTYVHINISGNDILVQYRKEEGTCLHVALIFVWEFIRRCLLASILLDLE